MSQPQIVKDPDEAKRIEKNLILRDIYYRLIGYYSNPKSLLWALKASDACKKEGYRFRLSEYKDFLENQELYQTNKTSPKYISRVSYGLWANNAPKLYTPVRYTISHSWSL